MYFQHKSGSVNGFWLLETGNSNSLLDCPSYFAAGIVLHLLLTLNAAELEDALRIEWAKAWARSRCWTEELQLLEEEWCCLPVTYAHHEKLWLDRMMAIPVSEIPIKEAEGKIAYAMWQADMYWELVQRAEITRTEVRLQKDKKRTIYEQSWDPLMPGEEDAGERGGDEENNDEDDNGGGQTGGTWETAALRTDRWAVRARRRQQRRGRCNRRQCLLTAHAAELGAVGMACEMTHMAAWGHGQAACTGRTSSAECGGSSVNGACTSGNAA
ncbi:hypothetical protein C8R45DRAFT_927893 [Mycena sanguinolenta]|nr:hypothetical protein C8R45DRAFT_927893 [Mycena sanguinolenta]